MASGLDYLTEQPAAPVQGALSAAAPITRFDQITPEMYSDMIMKLRGQAAPDFAVDPSLPVPTGIGDFFWSTPEKLAAYRQSGAEYEARTPQFNLFGDKENETETATVRPRQGAAGYQLLSNGQVIGEARSNEELSRLVEEANRLGVDQGKLANIRINEIPLEGYTQGQNLYTNAPEPPGQFGDFLKFALPMALNFVPGLGTALGASLGLSGTAATAVGTGLTSALGRTGAGVLAGDKLGDSLKAALTTGALSGLTAGALNLTGADKALSGLGSAKSSSLGGALADLGPDAITVLANKLPSAVIPGIASATGSVGSNLLQPQTQQTQIGTPEPGLTVTGSRGGSAFPTGGLSGAVSSAVNNLLTQPQQQAPQKQAPTFEDEIVVTGRPDAPIVSGALPFDPIVTGFTPTVPDLAVRPDVAPVEQAPTPEDEIVVTGSGYTAPTGGPSGAVSSAVSNLLTQPQLSDPNETLVEANPINDPAIGPPVDLFKQLRNPMINDATMDPVEPEKTPLQKALTTGGRILTGLSLLGGLAGGGGSPASGLGTGAAAIGTRASLDPVFGGQLPPARGIFAQGSRAPRVMGDIDYERYGYGPARSFFENVPETPEQYRAALAENAPRPMAAGAGTVGVPNILSEFRNAPAASPALQAVRRLAPGVSDAQIEAFLATPQGADFLAAIQEAETPQGAARGGAMSVKGRGKPSRDSYAVNGIGDGRSDEIPALLSDGEYVIDAETVAMLGDGSSKAGAKRLDDLRVKIRKHKGRNLAKGRFSDNAKAPEKYLSGGRT